MKSLIFSTFSDLYNINDYKEAFNVGEAGIYSLIDNDLLDAVIVIPESIKDAEITENIIRICRGRDIPVVSVDRRIEGCISVLFNYADSFEDVVRHIITVHGCRRINYMSGFRCNSFSDERTERFKKVLAEQGIEFDESRLGYGDFWARPAREVTEGWFSNGDPLPEAIICANDAMALEVCKVIKEHGLRVPDDIIVTGFDGIELEKYATPRLTTCAVDINESGMAAASAALRLINGESCPAVLEIPYRIRIAQSCGCVPMNMGIVADKVMELNTEMVLDEQHENYMYTYLAKGLACKEIPKLVDIIHRYCDTQTWCCIDADYFSDKRSKQRFSGQFTKQMKLLMYTVDPSQNNTVFDTKCLLPRLGEVLEEFDSLMFAPLHYEADLMGYIVFNVDVERTVFRYKRRSVMLTNQILESFRIRMLVERAKTKLADMHIHDPMTGLYNRRGFYQCAARMIRKLAKTGGSAVIFSVDMDGLKEINDVYGHNEGDKAIKAVASALVRCSPEGDICSRFGGDEFIVLSSGSDENHIRDFDKRVRALLAEFPKHSRAGYEIAVSIGSISTAIASVEELDECIRLADERMYSEKRSRKRAAPRN